MDLKFEAGDIGYVACPELDFYSDVAEEYLYLPVGALVEVLEVDEEDNYPYRIRPIGVNGMTGSEWCELEDILREMENE